MLIVGLNGKGRYTSPKGWAPPNDTEYRSHMSMWCLMAAPLLATCDLRKMDAATREILTAPEVIAVNQDPLGKQARRTIKDRDLEIWKKPLSNGEFALGLLNRGRDTQELKVKWSDIAIRQGVESARPLGENRSRGVPRFVHNQDSPATKPGCCGLSPA